MRTLAASNFAIRSGPVTPAWKLVIMPLVGVSVFFALRAHSEADDATRWAVVARDSTYTIAIDTARIGQQPYRNTYQIWYRTDHSALRFYNEKAFDREIVQAILNCDGYSFRIVSTEMSIRGGRSVARQITASGELGRQQWRKVEPGSIEADAARAACELGDQRKGRRH